MSELTKQMSKLLQTESLSHSLSKESLSAMLNEIKTLNDDCYKLNKQVEDLKADKIEARTKFNKLSEVNSKVTKDLNDFIKLKKELHERELVCIGTEIRNEFEKQRGDEHFSLLHTVFKNRSIRENVTRQFPVEETYTTEKDNYGNPGSSSTTTRVETSTDTKTVDEE